MKPTVGAAKSENDPHYRLEVPPIRIVYLFIKCPYFGGSKGERLRA